MTDATTRTIHDSISGFMLDQATLDEGEALGLAGFAYYFGGRGGVLGGVDADVVTAAFGFFHAGFVRKMWERALAVMTPADIALAYAESCRNWGRRRLGDVAGLERLAELAERVAGAADPAGYPLFAGWRALPLPDDPPGRTAQLLMVLREHRGGAHLIAVRACGLTPFEAVLAEGGPGNARFHGYRDEPYPDAGPLQEAHQRAETLTDTLDRPPYDALTPAEHTELVELVRRVEEALTAERG